MSEVEEQAWKRVRQSLHGADSIAWDTCHKIYVLMDEAQTEEMNEYGYDPLLRLEDIGVDAAYEMLKSWWEDSCALRFINAVSTVEGDPNKGFVDLIGQFELNCEGTS